MQSGVKITLYADQHKKTMVFLRYLVYVWSMLGVSVCIIYI